MTVKSRSGSTRQKKQKEKNSNLVPMPKILLKNVSLDNCPADIAIDGGKFSHITKAGEFQKEFPVSGYEIMDCTGLTAIPGFVNSHTHAAMSLMRGVGEDMLFHDWLKRIWDIEAGLDRDFVYWGTKAACLEMIRTGTTVFNDQYWFSAAAREAAAEMGILPAVSYIFLEGEGRPDAEEQKRKCQKWYDRSLEWEGRAVFTVSVHAVYSVSENLIRWAADFARDHGLKLHVHVSETLKENLDCQAAHNGLSPTEYLDSLGALWPDVIAAHSLWLSDNDVSILGGHGVSCVHNINSNLKLSSGYKFRYKELKKAGANLCLGTDGCASSNNLDMLEAMKTAAIVQKAWREDPSVMPLDELVDMATLNGARALGLDSGRIEEGLRADLCLVDTHNTFFLSPAPFLANLVYSSHSDCIRTVIAGGRIVMKDRVIPGEEEILAGAAKVLKQLKR